MENLQVEYISSGKCTLTQVMTEEVVMQACILPLSFFCPFLASQLLQIDSPSRPSTSKRTLSSQKLAKKAIGSSPVSPKICLNCHGSYKDGP